VKEHKDDTGLPADLSWDLAAVRAQWADISARPSAVSIEDGNHSTKIITDGEIKANENVFQTKLSCKKTICPPLYIFTVAAT